MTSISEITTLWEQPIARALIILAAALIAAIIVRVTVFPFIGHLSRKTRTGIDDAVLRALRGPVVYAIILIGAAWGLTSLDMSPDLAFVIAAAVKTVILLIWAGAGLQIGAIFLEAMSRNQDRLAWIQPRTLPILQITWKTLIIGGLLYFLLLAWHINPSSWLASAGILGIAIGFAAKDTLANLFAGVFIIADAPYQIGDFVILDNGIRGTVTDIGMRSSRVLTRDDIEVIVPNALIANSQIVNETRGRNQKMRVRVKVSAAYGSDVDQVERVLLSCADGVQHVSADPEPRVRFREFGDSGLLFELLTWIDEPIFRGRVLDELNKRVYKAFNQAGIEIPYAKQDVYVKQLPGRPAT